MPDRSRSGSVALELLLFRWSLAFAYSFRTCADNVDFLFASCSVQK